MDSNLNQLAPITDFDKAYILAQQAHEMGFRGATFPEMYFWLKGKLDLTGLSNTAGLPEDFPVPGSTLHAANPQEWTVIGPGTYNKIISGTITVADDEFAFTQFDGNDFNKVLKVKIPLQVGVDNIDPNGNRLPSEKGTARYAPAKPAVGIVSYVANQNVLLYLKDSDINNNDLWQDGFYHRITGVLNASPDFRCGKKKNYIKGELTIDYTFVLRGNAGVVFYNKLDQPLGSIFNPLASPTNEQLVISGTYVTPAGTEYFLHTHHKASATTHIKLAPTVDFEKTTSEVFLQSSEADQKIDAKATLAKNEAIADTKSKMDSFGLKNIPAMTNLYPILVNSDLNDVEIWTYGFWRNTGIITPDANWRCAKQPIPKGSHETNLYCAGNARTLIVDLNSNIKQIFSDKGNSTGTNVWPIVVDEDSFILFNKGLNANFNAFVRPTLDLKVNEIISESKANANSVSKESDKRIALLTNINRLIRPIISFHLDDGSRKNKWFLDALDVYGYKCSHAIITGRFPDTSPTLMEFYNEEDIKWLNFVRGDEIMGHTWHHDLSKPLNTLSTVELHKEIGNCLFHLRQIHNNIDVTNFISPQGSRNLSVDRVVRQYFESNSVTIADSLINSNGDFINFPPIDNYLQKRVSIDVASGNDGLGVSRIELLKYAVDILEQKGGHLNMAIHPHYLQYDVTIEIINGEEVEVPINSIDSRNEARELLSYIHSKGIPVMTLQQARRYYKNTSFGNQRLDSQYYEIGMDGTAVGNLF